MRSVKASITTGGFTNLNIRKWIHPAVCILNLKKRRTLEIFQLHLATVSSHRPVRAGIWLRASDVRNLDFIAWKFDAWKFDIWGSGVAGVSRGLGLP